MIQLACATSPSSGVYLLTLNQPLPKSSTGFKPSSVWPWILVLSNGDKCAVIQGTAPTLGPLNYGCTNGYATRPDATSEPWTVRYLPNRSHMLLTLSVTSVWE